MDEYDVPHHQSIRSIDKKIYKPYRANRCTKRCLHAGDTCISLFIISPLVILHWRAVWAIMADYNDTYFPPWNCFIFGIVLHTTIALMREFLYEQCSKSSKNNNGKTWSGQLVRYIFTKLYAYVFSMGCNMHWRGGWAVLDMYLGELFLLFFVHSAKLIACLFLFGNAGVKWNAVYVELGACLVVLLCFKSVRNLVAPPVIILTDSKNIAYQFPTRYRISVSNFIHSA